MNGRMMKIKAMMLGVNVCICQNYEIKLCWIQLSSKNHQKMIDRMLGLQKNKAIIIIMIKTKTSRCSPFSQQIIEVTYTKQNEEGNVAGEQLTIHFTQNQCRIIRIKNEIKLMGDAALKDMIIRVVELNIQYQNIGDKGCKIVSNVHLPKLKVLNLGSNKITAKGAFHLSKIPAKLSLIYLRDNFIGKQGVYWLSKLQSSLRLLNLQTNNLKDQDLTPLLLGQSGHMSQLILRLAPLPSGSTDITKNTLERLKSKYSSAQFYY